MMTPINHSTGAATKSSAGAVPNLVEELFSQFAATGLQGRHIGNHHLDQQLYLARRKLAETMGMTPDAIQQIQPFPPPPGNNATSVVMNDPAPLLQLIGELAKQPTPTQQAPSTPTPQPNPQPAPTPQTDAQPAAKRSWASVLGPGVIGAATALASLAGWNYFNTPSEPEPVEEPPQVSAEYSVNVR